MNSNNYDIYPGQSWSHSQYQHTDGQRLVPFLTGAIVSAPFWWASRPQYPYPYPYLQPYPQPYPMPYPYPFYPRYGRRYFYGRRPNRPFF